MKPLPTAVLNLLATLPEDKPCKIVLNTNGQGHWEVEAFTRHVFEVPVPVSRLKVSRGRIEKR